MGWIGKYVRGRARRGCELTQSSLSMFKVVRHQFCSVRLPAQVSCHSILQIQFFLFQVHSVQYMVFVSDVNSVHNSNYSVQFTYLIGSAAILFSSFLGMGPSSGTARHLQWEGHAIRRAP